MAVDEGLLLVVGNDGSEAALRDDVLDDPGGHVTSWLLLER